MGRTWRSVEPLPTIWEVDDTHWSRIEPTLLEDAPPPPAEHGGRRCIDLRAALNGISFRLRSGCQWNWLPKHDGDDSSVHRWNQRWCRNGVFERVWAVLVEASDDLGAVDWQWQAADGWLGKARVGGEQGRPEPHRPGQARHQAERGGRGRRRAPGGGDRRGQRARLHAAR